MQVKNAVGLANLKTVRDVTNCGQTTRQNPKQR